MPVPSGSTYEGRCNRRCSISASTSAVVSSRPAHKAPSVQKLASTYSRSASVRVAVITSRNASSSMVRRSPKYGRLEQRVEPDRQPGRKRRQPLEREQDARHERLARERVVADRQQLTRAAEQHLLVREEPR